VTIGVFLLDIVKHRDHRGPKGDFGSRHIVILREKDWSADRNTDWHVLSF
jgi:hypothetical protein